MHTHMKNQFFVAAIVYLGQMLLGSTIGWSAPVITKLQDLEQTPLSFPISDAQASWVGSLIYAGAILSSYIGSYISNQYGRKPCYFVAATAIALSYVIMAFAKNLAVIYATRILMGFGPGIMFVTNFVYLGEIASTHIRGMLLTILACFISLGTLLMYTVGPYVPFASICWLGFALSMAFISGCFFIPESPVFQLLKGQHTQAKDNLIYLGRANELEKVIAASADKSKTSKIDEWTELVTFKSNRKALFITISLGTLQQMSGIAAVLIFATSIFQLAGSSIEPDIATIILGLTHVLTSVITPWFVESIGRKSLLLYSSAFTSLSLATLALYFYLDRIGHPSVPNLGWLPLLALVASFLSYNLGLGIIPATLTGEMFRANVRSTGSSLSMTISWSIGFALSSTFGYMIPALGADATFLMYACFGALAFIFTVIFVPETKGKTLLEIEEMLSK